MTEPNWDLYFRIRNQWYKPAVLFKCKKCSQYCVTDEKGGYYLIFGKYHHKACLEKGWFLKRIFKPRTLEDDRKNT